GPSLWRMSIKRTILATVLVALALAGCSSDEDPAANTTDAADTTTTTVAAADEAPAPDEPGPFAVGRRTETVTDVDRDGRKLTVEIWYPAADAGAPSPYELIAG